MFVHLNFNINIESGLFLQICQNQQSHGAFCGPYALSFWRQLYWDRHYPPNLVNASWLYLCYSSAGRSVLGETVPEVLSTVEGGTQTEGTVSPNTDRPRPVNNIFIFFLLRFKSFRKILLQPPTYVCWRRARSCWCYSKRAIDCKPKQNITTWFLTCNLYYHN